MVNSAHIARLLGPALIGITVTEWINLDVFAAAAGPTFATHVYSNGTLIFIAGLAIVRAHNTWSRQWPVLIMLWVGLRSSWLIRLVVESPSFLSTDDFCRDYNDMRSVGIKFVRGPTVEEYGTVAVFEALYGNLWDLVQPVSVPNV
jgi:hypothetical protein